jgi:hypothetical protein
MLMLATTDAVTSQFPETGRPNQLFAESHASGAHGVEPERSDSSGVIGRQASGYGLLL